MSRWKPNAEARSVTVWFYATAHPYAPLMMIDDLPSQGEPKTIPLLSLGREERLKDRFNVVSRNPWPVVRDHKAKCPVVLAQAKTKGAFATKCIYRVADEIRDGLKQFPPVHQSLNPLGKLTNDVNALGLNGLLVNPESRFREHHEAHWFR